MSVWYIRALSIRACIIYQCFHQHKNNLYYQVVRQHIFYFFYWHDVHSLWTHIFFLNPVNSAFTLKRKKILLVFSQTLVTKLRITFFWTSTCTFYKNFLFFLRIKCNNIKFLINFCSFFFIRCNNDKWLFFSFALHRWPQILQWVMLFLFTFLAVVCCRWVEA